MVGIIVNNTGNRMECSSFLSSQGSSKLSEGNRGLSSGGLKMG